MQKDYVIQTTSLSYHYSKNVQTLFDISLKIERGSIYGFLGPNGSGKTTTLSLILGLLPAKQGNIEIFGRQFQSNRIDILSKIGALIETPSLYGHLTAVENLDIYRRIYGVSKARVREVLEIAGLADTGGKLTKRFSLGMKQRLSIALALLPGPELLVLDEPSNGLDPAGIIELRHLIRKLNKEFGMTIVISSHLLAEVEKMVTHLGIIYKGRMLFQGSLPELHSYQQKGSKIQISTSNNEQAWSILQEENAALEDGMLMVPFRDRGQVARINRTLMHHDLDVFLLHPKENDLEQLFIDLTSAQS